jgi:DnaJ-domain-containing protein 1
VRHLTRLFVPTAFLAITACGGPREVAVRVLIPGADSALAPSASLPIVALPYDRDSVLAAMEARAARPRPHTVELDELFARYREPFEAYTIAIARADAFNDTLAAIRASLDTIARSAPAYQELYQRFADVTDSVTAADRIGQAAEQRLTAIREELGGPIERLRVEVRAWEDSTFSGYDTLVQNLAEAKMRLPASDTTGTDGWASLTLAPGAWWIYVRSWDAHDPNSEWYWNIPVTSDTLVLEPSNGQRRPRY